MNSKPQLSSKKIWSLNFGYLGLQVCLSLILANASRILSSLGADTDNLAFLWLVAPLAGLLVQPVVGYLSDKTWCAWGRRIPYIAIGVMLTAVMMLLMPNSYLLSRILPPVLSGVLVFFLAQSSLNVAMQPYRSLIKDMVNDKQSDLGYSIQTFLSNIGGIVGSFLPFILAFGGISNQAANEQRIAPTITWSFYIGAALVLITSLRTCLSVKEYPPQQFAQYNFSDDPNNNEKKKDRRALMTLLRLSVVQFFSWFAFYYIWVFTTEGIAQNIWNTEDPLSASYNSAGNWFGVMSGIYSLTAAIFSIFLPKLTSKFGRNNLYVSALIAGGLSVISIYFITNQYLLLIPMLGVGIAWAMILTTPFTILYDVVPSAKIGLYMGLVNITIVIPQITAGLVGSYIFKDIAYNKAISMLLVSGISLLIGAMSVVLIKNKRETH